MDEGTWIDALGDQEISRRTLLKAAGATVIGSSVLGAERVGSTAASAEASA